MGNRRRETVAERGTGVVRRAVEEIWNQGDLGLADLLFAPTYVNHGGLIPDVVRGPEAIKVSVAMYRAAFPGFYISLEAVMAVGEMVDLRWTAHGAPPDSRPQVTPESHGDMLQGTTRGRIAANQIAESWTTWDREGVLRRLGIVPPEDGHVDDTSLRA